jgi:hypothetical protein
MCASASARAWYLFVLPPSALEILPHARKRTQPHDLKREPERLLNGHARRNLELLTDQTDDPFAGKVNTGVAEFSVEPF